MASETTDPWDGIDPETRDNYKALHHEGREWDVMGDQAERMGDHRLAAALRSEAAGKTDRASADGKGPNRSTPPQNRTTPAGAKTNG